MAAQYWTGERQFPFMSPWKGCIFSAIHFNSVCHAVLIYWSSALCGEWKGFRGSSEVCHAVTEKRCIDLSSYHYPSLFVYYLFDSSAPVLWSEKLKRPHFCYFQAGRLLGQRKEVCVCIVALVCASVTGYMYACGTKLHILSKVCVCVCLLCILKKEGKKNAIVCFLSTSCPNTLSTTTDGCVSSERWFKPHISMKRVTAERDEGPNGCLFCHKSSPGCDEGRSILQ